jgi:hypothetical protein
MSVAAVVSAVIAVAIAAFIIGRFFAPSSVSGNTRESVQRAARAAYDAGHERASAGDWLGALRKYSEARDLDPGTPGLDAAVAEVWDKMHDAGNKAFVRATQYENDGRAEDAVEEYEHAAEWLPVEAPNRAIARDRATRLKAARR